LKRLQTDLHLRKGIEAGWNFDGKVAVVTGGNSGIGKDVCITLASLGSRVVIGGRREPEGHAVVSEIEAIGGTARFLRTDVVNESDVRSLVEAAVSRFWSARLSVQQCWR